jgi:glycosyltransferase involved in cell wall biosynthesis
MTTPLVSVIIPTYQRAAMIADAIESVLQQAWHDYEIIVADDGSRDETAAILKQYGTRVRYDFAPNAGASSARNRGASLARGEYLAFLDSDDLWTTDKLASQMPLLLNQPTVGWVYCDMDYFGNPDAERRPSSFTKIPAARGKLARHMLQHGCPMHTPTLVVRRQLFEQVGGYNIKYRVYEDHDLYFRLAQVSPADYVDQVLVHCRRGDDRITAKRTAAQNFFNYAHILRRVWEQNPEFATDSQADVLRQRWQVYYFEAIISAASEDNWELAQQAIAEVKTLSPWSFKVLSYQIMLRFPNLFKSWKRL